MSRKYIRKTSSTSDQPKTPIVKMPKPIVKILDMRHANLGDRLASIMAYDFLASIGIPVCGGDLDELKVIKDIEPTHLLVWGGGTIYETETGEDGPIRRWGLLEDSRKMKVLFVGPGFNGINKDCPQEIIKEWKEVFDNATLISLRDRESAEECQRVFGVNIDERWCHAPEISFLCKKYIDTNAPRIEDLAAYSVTGSYFTLEDQVKLVNAIHDQGMRILFFPHSDDDYNYYVNNNLVSDKDYIVNLRESPIAALQLLASCKIQVTARLHGMIMSIITETPFIHVNANMLKVYWQLEEINIPHYKYAFENPNRGLLGNYKTLDFSSIGEEINTLRNDIETKELLVRIGNSARSDAERHLEKTKTILLADKD